MRRQYRVGHDRTGQQRSNTDLKYKYIKNREVRRQEETLTLCPETEMCL